MKRSQKSVPNAMTGGLPTDQGFASNNNPQSINWVNKGGRNASTNESMRGAGQVAPRPQNSKQPLLGASKHTAGILHSMARVRNTSSSPTGKMPTAGSFTPPINNALANLTGQATGQAEVNPRGNSSSISPLTRTPGTSNPLATKKPRTRAALAFYGDN